VSREEGTEPTVAVGSREAVPNLLYLEERLEKPSLS
jgi:hypothetical protein